MKIRMGNEFFGRTLRGAAVLSLFLSIGAQAQRPEKRVSFHDNKISIVLPDGWKASDKKADRLVGGFESSDQRSSVFFTLAGADTQSDMMEIMDGTVKNFEETFIVKKVGDYKTGQVQGPDKKWSAIFTTLELEMKTNKDPIPFRFYVMVFDTGTEMYMIQGSTMAPVRKSREREIFEMIRSIIASK